MIVTRINTKTFKSLVAEQRDYHERDVEAGIATWADYRQTLRDEVAGRRHIYINEAFRPARTAADLKAELVTAQIAAGLAGATDKQIALIMALSVEARDFSEIGTDRLTKSAASNIIDTMKKA